MADPGVTRVLVVDDHKSFTESLGMVIDLQPDLECVGRAGTLAEAIDMAGRVEPDVIVLDVELPDGDGVEATSRLRALQPRARVMILTAHAGAEVLARAARAGAHGFFPKESTVGEILAAIRTVGTGGLLVGAEALQRAVQAPAPAPRAPELWPMTAREREVLALLGEGLDPKTIAVRLGISVHTSRGHVKNLLAKLGAHSQLEAVVIAVRHGLITTAHP